MNIFVANLDKRVEEGDLEEIFSEYGTVLYASVVRDGETKTSKGYGFIRMENATIGERAIDGLHGRLLAGRKLAVLPAETPEEKGHRERPKDEVIPLKVVDKAGYSTEKTGDGFVRVCFDKE